VPFDGAPASAIIGLTLFEDLKAQRQLVWNFTPDELPELALMIRLEQAVHKDRLPLFSLVQFGTVSNERGCLRYNDNAIAIGGILGDYDAECVSIEEAHRRLVAAGIPHLIYDTPSSTLERPRWRLLAWFSRPYEGSPDELEQRFKLMVARANGILGGILARESFNLAQSFYYGGLEEKPPHILWSAAGAPIDLRDDLDAGAIGKPERCKPELAADIIAAWNTSDDDPRLVTLATTIARNWLKKRGPATQPRGGRAWRLVWRILDWGTEDGLVLSDEGVSRVIQETGAALYTTAEHVRDMRQRRVYPLGHAPASGNTLHAGA